MNFFGEWIKHIVLLILLATFLDLILPNTSMRKYVKLVVGFLLILLILSPVLQLFHFDHERLLLSLDQLLKTDVQNTEQQIKQETEKIEGLQSYLLLEEVQERWESELKAMIEGTLAVEIAEVQLDMAIDGNQVNVQQVFLTMRKSAPVQAEEQQEGSTHTTPPVELVKEVEAVREVNIAFPGNKSKEAEAPLQISAEQKKIEKEVLKLLQTEWNISVDKIHIAWSRG